MNRRTVIAAGMAALSLRMPTRAEATHRAPIVDAHIHLFDPNRPQGTPALIPGSQTSTTGSFPAAYEHWAAALGVVGAIHIEASNWIEDNLWALQVARSSDIMLGVIGNINPEKSDFDEYLERFSRDPLFRGIRYGNIWGYDLATGSRNPAVIARLKRLSEANLVLDSATPNLPLLEAILRLNDAIPELRIVIDHLPGFDPTPESHGTYVRILQDMRGRKNIHVKLSQIIHRKAGAVSTRLADYKDTLDLILDTFGTDRVMFGSDYPTLDMVTTPDHVFRIAREYFAERSKQAQRECLYRTALRVYGCRARTDRQRALLP